VKLDFHTIDQLNQIFLVAAWESHARHGVLDSDERFVDRGDLRPIHERRI
jgi:hypothetical protein